MRFRWPAPTIHSVAASVCRQFSSATKYPKRPSLAHINYKHKPQALSDAHKALTEYLHTTRSLPYTYAEHISKNSSFLLSSIVSKLPFSTLTFSRTLQKYFSYHPINEFEFFFESIGINPSRIGRFLPQNKFFFSEDSQVFDVACALSDLGFPWRLLGRLYEEEDSIFDMRCEDLTARIYGFKDCYGFSCVSVIGICLAFPYVLKDGQSRLGENVDGLFDDLRRVFIDFDLTSSVAENVDAWYEVCRKIRVFYDIGCEKGMIGDLMGRNKHLLLGYPEEVIVNKAEFFRRLSAKGRNVGLLILEKPEILNFELESRKISVLGFLKHFGLSEEKLKSVAQDYPHVSGRNKIANLPHVMRAMDLHEWFFDKIKNENHNLLADYSIRIPDEDLDSNYIDSLEEIQRSRFSTHKVGKLNLLHEIGYGENSLTIKVFMNVHGSRRELQERFDCLLHAGIEFSKLCKMTTLKPRILNQSAQILERKVQFLLQYMEISMHNLENFPACLCFDLEKRIKPRFRIHTWLEEKGLDLKHYSLASMTATCEKNFIAHLSSIHPAVPKHWLECFFLIEG